MIFYFIYFYFHINDKEINVIRKHNVIRITDLIIIVDTINGNHFLILDIHININIRQIRIPN